MGKTQLNKEELAQVLSSTVPSWDGKADDISDNYLATFNQGLAQIMKLYPKYDVEFVDDYQGKPDDELHDLLMKLEEGEDALGLVLENANVQPSEVIAESLGWPKAYKGKKFNSEECEKALDEKFAIENWDAVKTTMNKFPSRYIKVAVAKSRNWKQFKDKVEQHIPQIAAYLLGPELDGNVKCWEGRADAPIISQSKMLTIKELKGGPEVAKGIMDTFIKNYPMDIRLKSMLRSQVVPNLHVRIYENATELDATEFADMAAALNTSAQELAKIVHGFVAKAIGKAMGGGASEGAEAGTKKEEIGKTTQGKNNAYVDEEAEIVKCFDTCFSGGMTPDECVAKCMAEFKKDEKAIRTILQTHNVNLTGSADTTATLKSEFPKASTDADAASKGEATVAGAPKTEIEQKKAEKERLMKLHKERPDDDQVKKDLNTILKSLGEPEIKEAAEPAFKVHVNKQYQTASGQVMTLRKMTGGTNPLYIFEDDATGEKVEVAHDKFMGMNPAEVNMDSTKMKKALINKFKRKINQFTMKHTARIISKSKAGRKIYENLDSIKTNGRPVGDIAGVVIGSSGNTEKNNEFFPGDKVKTNKFEGEIQAVEMNEHNEPEVIVKTSDGEEVTISVKDFEDQNPMVMTDDDGGGEPLDEHVEYKGYSLLMNAEDQTWCVMQGDTKIEDEGACGVSEEEAKAWVDAKLEEEGGEGGEGGEENEEEEEMHESISSRFITESKSGGLKLKSFSQMLKETTNPSIKKNLISTKQKPDAAFRNAKAVTKK